MKKTYFLYNSKAGKGDAQKRAEMVAQLIESDEQIMQDLTQIVDYSIFEKLTSNDSIVILGGDGTLNVFINNIKSFRVKARILYYPCGNGNDFFKDIATENARLPIEIGRYIKDLPIVKLNGESRYFINNVGFGIDGFCCEEGDKIKSKDPQKKVNYTQLAIKGVLFKYKPTDATVIVDGKKYQFKNVWLAPTMNGRYYGGGMMPTPAQQRLSSTKNVSVMLFFGRARLKTLTCFPSIFTGEHVYKTKNVAIFTGHNIKVIFSEPRAVQIDGETVLNVKEYTVFSPMAIAEQKRKMRGGR